MPLPAFKVVGPVDCSANMGVSGVEFSESRTTVNSLVQQIRAVDRGESPATQD